LGNTVIAAGRQSEKAIVAGGGIGGLAAALGLARNGRLVVVLEKAAAFVEIGAGLQLAPNAFHAFDALGLGEAARSIAVAIDQLRLMDALTAEKITSIDLGEGFRSRFKNPYAVAHRGDLHKILLRACREHPYVELRVNSEVVAYEQDGASVRVRLAARESVDGSLLIGADGLWSNVRKGVIGDGSPRVSGHETYRSVIPTEQMPQDLRWNAATLWAGPKVHLVHYPLTGWKLFNLVVTCDTGATEPVAGEPVAKGEVRDKFQHISPRAQAIIESGTNWKRWVLCDRDPVERWVDGRVTLLGDAAHPMLQYAAQGACMALEDAVTLGHVLASHDDVEAALAAYQRYRVVRTTRVQLLSRLLGQFIYHASGAVALTRNAIMGAMHAADHYDRLAWLYGGLGLSEAASVRSDGAGRPSRAP
jgi:2-polyprenyl-6-methoxyphenol hydroxylase-like FAD-dependent oxidoreductase